MTDVTDKPIVLIVDDNPANLGVLSEILDETQFEVWIARDGESALRKTERTPPDLILLDIMMPPGIDGFETCRRLQANPATKGIPVIFTSALADTVDKVKGLSIGAVDYITKPFQQEEVLARVQLHLKLRSLNRIIEKQNQQLEQRVAERTAELSLALTKLEAAQDRLRHDALHDTLTGLSNRARLMQQLSRVIHQSGDRANSYAALFLDLDRFKVINDSLGHLVGDELLKAVAERLLSCVHPRHVVSRLGGDEFVILLEQLQNIEEATAIAQHIIDNLRQPFKLKDYEIFTGASIGITFSTMGYAHPEDILRDADVAMYQAKQAGKGRYEVLTPAMRTRALERLQLENDLQHAIETREFCLFYQPIVALQTATLVGFEALVRWVHPTRGFISPSEFIPIVEETGAIVPLGWWVLEEACRQTRRWQEQFPDHSTFKMNVNFSPLQLRQEGIFRRVQAICQDTQLPPEFLKLEITESSFLDRSPNQETLFAELKSLGIELCIDDFGTGYSSLSRLHEIPIDTLKIDRDFIRCIKDEGNEVEVVRTIMALARSLRMEVVAEGVETVAQMSVLRRLGCELAQGYLFSKPVDAAAATLLLANPQFLRNQLVESPTSNGKPFGKEFEPKLEIGKI